MYIKIQKENSDNYLIFEGKEIQTTKFRFNMSSSEYLNFLKEEISLLEFNTICSVSELNGNIRKTLNLNNEKIVTNYSIGDVNEILENPEKYVSYGGSLASVIVDGQQYITFGHIYVLNDRGQTIQSL